MAENKYLKWLSSQTPSVYWHDSAIVGELDAAMENGAVGMTTNPFLIASTLTKAPDFESEAVRILKQIRTEGALAAYKAAL